MARYSGYWVKQNVYRNGDVVPIDNTLYICVHTSPFPIHTLHPTASSHWAVIPNLVYRGCWSSKMTYHHNDVVWISMRYGMYIAGASENGWIPLITYE